ncbi:unnamed protein product [Staurois parvus]|uniref:Uncharacterized protein n=1 Tax=Staurois parvus TaxID=386267 RepID=A0ABN9AY21_9NEOB|nr:unnamed protein product [Staurois parvus]
MSLFDIFKFPPRLHPPVRPDVAGNGTRKTDADIGRRRWPGMLQGGHRGSEGQGRCRRDPGATLQCIPECSSRLPLVVLKLYPELHSGIPPGSLMHSLH